MLKQELLYEKLNNISNNEFEDIVKVKTPVEEVLNIEIQKRIKEYKSKIDENLFEIKDYNDNDKEVFVIDMNNHRVQVSCQLLA